MGFEDYVILLLIVLIVLVIVSALVIILKGTKKDVGPSQVQIKKAVNEAVTDLSQVITDSISNQNKTFNNQLMTEVSNVLSELKQFTKDMNKFRVDMIKDNYNSFNDLNKKYEDSHEILNKNIKENFNDFVENIKERLSKIEETVNNNLKEIRKDNTDKLDRIQGIVDEKLTKTLQSRIDESFKTVIEQFAVVNSAIGEIKGIASDVGSLKNVLTNVKTKGILGEIILGNIIKDILTTAQYEENFVTNKKTKNPVEFAIKMPGVDDECIYLPVDSKLPTESYNRLLSAIDNGDKDGIVNARKEIKTVVKKFAKDISSKYIDVPSTTDFAVMFIPLEGLYAEIINLGLLQEVMNECKVVISGPSTFSAMLNSLRMGFKTLTIQKKSAEVFKMLGAVKTEFSKYQGLLEKAKKKVDEASDDLNVLSTTRTKAIVKHLNGVEGLSDDESSSYLELDK